MHYDPQAPVIDKAFDTVTVTEQKAILSGLGLPFIKPLSL